MNRLTNNVLVFDKMTAFSLGNFSNWLPWKWYSNKRATILANAKVLFVERFSLKRFSLKANMKIKVG